MVRTIKSILLLGLSLFLFNNFISASGTDFNWNFLMHLRDSCIALHDTLGISFDSLNFDPDSLSLEGNEFMQNNGFISDNLTLAGFIVPIQGKVISRFGVRSGRMHTGTDVKLNLGDTVVSAYNGIVTRAKSYYGYGSLVVISHANKLETYYAHLSQILVKVGDTIRTGQIVGLGGRTGRATTNHLHFEIRENGKPYNSELVFNFDKGNVRPEAVAESSLASLFRVFNKIENVSINTINTPIEYVIKAGDSLWTIARRFRTSIQSLCEINQIQTGTVLRIGSVLKLH
jgi:hypothetical protein